MTETTNETIRVHLNGEDRTIPTDLTIRGLLEHLEIEPGMVVVERNREILERDRYDCTAVEEGDRLELVHFVGGG